MPTGLFDDIITPPAVKRDAIPKPDKKPAGLFDDIVPSATASEAAVSPFHHEPKPPAPPKPESGVMPAVREIATAIPRGILEAGTMATKAVRAFSPEGSDVNRLAREGGTALEEMGKSPAIAPREMSDVSKHPVVATITKGLEAIPQMGPFAVPVVGPALGAAAFAGSGYTESYDRVKENQIKSGASEADAHNAAHHAGLTSGIIMGALAPILGQGAKLTTGIFRKALGTGAKSAAEVLEKVAKPETLAEYGKNFLKGTAHTVGTLAGMSAGTTESERYFSPESARAEMPTAWEAAKGSLPAAIGMSGIFGIFGLASMPGREKQHAKMMQSLSDPTIDVQDRAAAVKSVHDAISSRDKDSADNFALHALKAIRDQQPVDMTTESIKPFSLQGEVAPGSQPTTDWEAHEQYKQQESNPGALRAQTAAFDAFMKDRGITRKSPADDRNEAIRDWYASPEYQSYQKKAAMPLEAMPHGMNMFTGKPAHDRALNGEIPQPAAVPPATPPATPSAPEAAPVPPLTKDGAAEPPKAEPAKGASLKLMITKADEAALRDLGYDQKAINSMKPAEAGRILEDKERAKAPETAPEKKENLSHLGLKLHKAKERLVTLEARVKNAKSPSEGLKKNLEDQRKFVEGAQKDLDDAKAARDLKEKEGEISAGKIQSDQEAGKERGAVGPGGEAEGGADIQRAAEVGAKAGDAGQQVTPPRGPDRRISKEPFISERRLAERRALVAALGEPANKFQSKEFPIPEKAAPEGKAAEEVKPAHDFSSTQVNLPKAEAKEITDFGKSIPDSEVYTDPNDPTVGREDKPHITVKYGIHTENAEKIKALLEGAGKITAKLGKMDVFSPEDKPYDVVMVPVESPELHDLNAKISEGTEVTDTHPEYQPHVTIAYVKKGEGAKYKGDARFEGKEISFSDVHFTDKDEQATKIKLETKAHVPETKEPKGEPVVSETETKEPRKEPWQMTREKYATTTIDGAPITVKEWQEHRRQTHEREVKMALESGKAVPPEVLKEYPDLTKEPKAEAPKKGEIKINDIPDSLEITTTAIRAKTGQKVKVKENAREAFARLEESLESVKKLIGCLQT